MVAPGFPDITEIYSKSIVDWYDLYESITVMEVKTSNNHKGIMKLPFHVFSTKIQFLNKYIESENKTSGGTEGEQDSSAMQNDMQNQAKNMMNNSKNMIKTGGFKTPKI